MSTVTISKKEYAELTDKRFRYEYLRRIMEEDIFSPPPTRDIKEVVKNFVATKRYNKKFLAGLVKGLGRSSHFRT